MERYADAEHRFDVAGGYEYENRIARVLGGLGFRADQYLSLIHIFTWRYKQQRRSTGDEEMD